MKDEAAPIPVQFTITLTALVYPEPEAGGYSAEVPACQAAILRAKRWRRSRPTSARPRRGMAGLRSATTIVGIKGRSRPTLQHASLLAATGPP